MGKKILLVSLIIVIVVAAGLSFYFWEGGVQSEKVSVQKTSEISEKAETPKPEKIKDNDLMMDAVRSESGVSQELVLNSCVSSIMKETEDLIMVYIRWTCSDVGGGARAILKKQDAQYKFIAMLQDWPSCDLMEEYSVPKSFYEACY